MTLQGIQQAARRLGYRDARMGRVYRHSIDPGSWLTSWLPEYDIGWNAGRKA